MSNKINLDASSYELIRQDKANIVLAIEVIKETRAAVQKEIKKKADAAFKALKAFKGVSSSTQSQSIVDNVIQKDNKWEKEGFKGVFTIGLIGYDFDELTNAIEAVESNAQVSSIITSLSTRAKSQMEAKLTQEAIANFKERARLITSSLDFKEFTIGKMTISRARGEDNNRAYALSNMASSSSCESESSNSCVQPRDERITVNIEGTIFLK